VTRIAILKTGALGDVLRTTSILPGLARRYPALEVTWVTAPPAVDLVRRHPLVARVETVDPRDPAAVATLGERLADAAFDRVLSFDDEVDLCRLATALARGDVHAHVSGAYLDAAGERRYTPDVAPWFDMGLLSTFGKAEADRRKVANAESHPAIYARMLGIAVGEPELPLPDDALAFAAELTARTGLHDRGPVVGLNTGAGGRWESKRLPIERVAELVQRVQDARRGAVGFLLLGGPEEEERNAGIRAAVAAGGAAYLVDGGTANPMTRFAALVDRLDVLVTSDSLGMHVAIARRVPVVAFFAPTSAAEIELYGRGEKVVSSAPDYCSYRPDADSSTLTAETIAAATLRVLDAGGARAPGRAHAAGREAGAGDRPSDGAADARRAGEAGR
jgi:heptosyltransferase-2